MLPGSHCPPRSPVETCEAALLALSLALCVSAVLALFSGQCGISPALLVVGALELDCAHSPMRRRLRYVCT